MFSARLMVLTVTCCLCLPSCGENPPAPIQEAKAQPVLNQPSPKEATKIAPSPSIAPTPTVAPSAAGKLIFQAHRCWFCHNVMDAPPKLGPNLNRVGSTLTQDALTTWIKNPKALKPGTTMPAFTGTGEELEQLIAYLVTLDAKAK